MKKLFILGAVLLAFCSSVKAETFAEKMASYTESTESVVRGQCGPCYPFYLQISADWAFLQDLNDGGTAVTTDSGAGLNAAIGWYEGDARIEFEYSRFSFDADTANGIANTVGNIGLDAWMLNGYYDVDLGSGITGYAGGGIGLARAGAHSLQVGAPAAGAGDVVNAQTAPVFAYQLRVGASMDITDRAEMFGGYRYLGTTEIDIAHDNIAGAGPDIFSDEFQIHGIEGGLRFKF